MALIADIQVPQGRIMGHAGAIVGAGEKKALKKVKALEHAGVIITNHPSKFGDCMARLLGHGNGIHAKVRLLNGSVCMYC